MLCYAQSEIERLYDVRLNHVLIQLYRNGNDYIRKHADKTLDIAKGSTIFNVSLGASRHMYLRLKKVGIGASISSTNEMAGNIDSAMKIAILVRLPLSVKTKMTTEVTRYDSSSLTTQYLLWTGRPIDTTSTASMQTNEAKKRSHLRRRTSMVSESV